MATEVVLHLRNGLSVPVTFEPDEDWEVRDTERVLLLLDGKRRVRAVANLADFVHLTAELDDAGDGE